jgi:hypothetical protein
MTRDEFAGAAAILDGGWPGPFTPADEHAYFFRLDDLAIVDVMRALKALRRSKFRPTPSEILEALSPEIAAIPTFDEMFTLLFSTRGALAAKGLDGTRRRLEGMHPLVVSFAERQGIQRLKEMPVHDQDDGHWRRKELKDAWAAHLEAMEGRDVAALASGRRGAGELDRLDPLAALGISDRPALAPGE